MSRLASSKMDIQHMRVILHYIGFVMLITNFSNGQPVILTGPPDGAIEQGSDTVYTCTGGEAPYIFIWIDLSVATGVNIFLGGQAAYDPLASPKYLDFDVSEIEGTSTMTITNTLIEDEGHYSCVELPAGTGKDDDEELTVEVKGTWSVSPDSPIKSNINDMFEATCEALEGRPEVTITWMLGDGASPCDTTVVTPLPAGSDLFSKRSVCTFQATSENNNGTTLTCVISGHLVPDLNGGVTATLDKHTSPSDAGTIVIADYVTQGAGITVSCSVQTQPSPVMRIYSIFSNGESIHGSMEGVNTVLVEDPIEGTNYTCMAGNYLGNTSLSAAVTYDPSRPTIPPPTTETIRTRGATTSSSEPTPCTCVPTGLSPGASAGIAVLVILLVASVIINIIQFIMLRRHETRPGFEKSEKTVAGEGRNVSNEENDNMAYEMIQSGDRAYTSLKLGPSHSPIIAPENVTFFTRLGSIGRGDFGGVWKGELRSNQSRLDVAIRQIPDQVTKSKDVLRAVKVLSELPDQPNVVKCLGYCQEQGSILYEFISGGTLLTHLQTTGVQSQPTYGNLKPKRVRIDEGSLLNLAWQIAKGMQYLASKKIIHGTLCAHNVLLPDRKQCKLSDYGLSLSLFSGRGKPTRWSSPETMVTGDPSTEGDSWSFGIVLWEIVTLGARPYPKMTFDTVQKEVANGYQMPRPRHCGQEVYTIMSGCWEKEATNRSNFDQILKSLERILEKTHNYLSLNDLDEGLYASTLDM